ncbi:hypothetical protein WG66_004713 [Moniliophthora roreri]|nr:hypothetical protein WG66_004713 [Moniliophthora roreri]
MDNELRRELGMTFSEFRTPLHMTLLYWSLLILQTLCSRLYDAHRPRCNEAQARH